MQFECATKDLAQALKVVARIEPAISTVPQFFLLEAKEGSGEAIATVTNGTQQMRIRFPATVERSGSIAAPLQKALALVSRFSGSIMDIGVDGSVMAMRCAGATYALQGVNEDELPVFDLKTPRHRLRFNQAHTFLSLLGPVSFAAARNTLGITPSLGGVFLHAEDGRLVGVATDGFRLARASIAADAPVPGDAKIVIPVSSADQIEGLLSAQKDKPVDVVFHDRSIEVSCGTGSYISQVMATEYPVYKKILPAPGIHTFSIPAKMLIEAMGRMACVIPAEKLKPAVAKIVSSIEGSVTMSHLSTEGHLASERLDVTQVVGDGSIHIQIAQANEALAKWGNEEIQVRIETQGMKMILTSEARPDYMQILMGQRRA